MIGANAPFNIVKGARCCESTALWAGLMATGQDEGAGAGIYLHRTSGPGVLQFRKQLSQGRSHSPDMAARPVDPATSRTGKEWARHGPGLLRHRRVYLMFGGGPEAGVAHQASVKQVLCRFNTIFFRDFGQLFKGFAGGEQMAPVRPQVNLSLIHI